MWLATKIIEIIEILTGIQSFSRRFLHWFIIYALSQKCKKRLLASSCLSVCPYTWNDLAPIRRILMKFEIRVFLENLCEIFNCDENLDKNNGYFTRTPIHIYYKISLASSQNERNSRQIGGESQDTWFMLHNFFPKIVPFMKHVGKCCTAEQPTGIITSHVHYMLDT
jgi:hypothetical protein